MVVAEELKNRPVQGIGPRLGGHVHVGSGSLAEFRRGNVGLDLEFLDGVNGGLNAVSFEHLFVVVSAVQREIVLFGAVAAHTVVGSARDLVDRAPRTYRTGNQRNQLREVAAV